MATHTHPTPAATWVAIDIAKRYHAVLIEDPDGKHQGFRMASSSEDHQRLVDLFHGMPGPVRIADGAHRRLPPHLGVPFAQGRLRGAPGVFPWRCPLSGGVIQFMGQERPEGCHRDPDHAQAGHDHALRRSAVGRSPRVAGTVQNPLLDQSGQNPGSSTV